MKSGPITTLFLDIGGVLLTNGWDRSMRARAAEHFRLDAKEMDETHHLTYDTYEVGKLSLDEYLDRVVFHRDRSFSREEFKAFMFAQSQPYPEMIQLVRDLKARYQLKVAVISNEGRDLTVHRIRRFELGGVRRLFRRLVLRPLPEAGSEHLPDRPGDRAGPPVPGGLYRGSGHVSRSKPQPGLPEHPSHRLRVDAGPPGGARALAGGVTGKGGPRAVEAQQLSVRKVVEEGARELHPDYFASSW